MVVWLLDCVSLLVVWLYLVGGFMGFPSGAVWLRFNVVGVVCFTD